MRKLILVLLLISFLPVTAQETFSVTVNFKGMKSDKGDLYIALYDKDGDFLKKAIKGEIVTVKEGKATVEFSGLPSGEYAISCFHDKNDNKKMDTNFFGIPKEPIGISNDATGFMGPPKYKDAKFMVDKDLSLVINVK